MSVHPPVIDASILIHNDRCVRGDGALGSPCRSSLWAVQRSILWRRECVSTLLFLPVPNPDLICELRRDFRGYSRRQVRMQPALTIMYVLSVALVQVLGQGCASLPAEIHYRYCRSNQTSFHVHQLNVWPSANVSGRISAYSPAWRWP